MSNDMKAENELSTKANKSLADAIGGTIENEDLKDRVQHIGKILGISRDNSSAQEE